VPTATVPQVTASLAWGLIKNHAFIDRNKRIGAAALFLLLSANGHRVMVTQEEETAIFRRAAASEITEEQFTAWVERSVSPKEIQSARYMSMLIRTRTHVDGIYKNDACRRGCTYARR
jgi:prophage maintenance system killer protein